MKSFRAHLAIHVVLWLAVLTVAAAEVPTSKGVQGTVGQEVLLHCNCRGRNENQFVNWQKGDDAQVSHYKKGDINPEKNQHPQYQGRVQLFLHQDKDNCSVLLFNVTVADHGTYRCSFYMEKVYIYNHITLDVSANYSVCVDQIPVQPGAGGREYVCQASGGFPKGTISWNYEGSLKNSSGETAHQNQSTGLYQLRSHLILPHDWNRKPQCVVRIGPFNSSSDSSCSRAVKKKPTTTSCKYPDTYLAGGSSAQENPEDSQRRMIVSSVSSCLLLLLLVVLVVAGVLVWRSRRQRRPTQPEGEETVMAPFVREHAPHTCV